MREADFGAVNGAITGCFDESEGFGVFGVHEEFVDDLLFALVRGYLSTRGDCELTFADSMSGNDGELGGSLDYPILTHSSLYGMLMLETGDRTWSNTGGGRHIVACGGDVDPRHSHFWHVSSRVSDQPPQPSQPLSLMNRGKGMAESRSICASLSTPSDNQRATTCSKPPKRIGRISPLACSAVSLSET